MEIKAKTVTVNLLDWEMAHGAPLTAGIEVMLVEKDDTSNGKKSFSIRLAPDGIGGNEDGEVKRFHGWRGTTNDSAIYAHGMREVLSVSEPDGRGWAAVKVGPDLHPDRD